MTYQVTPIHAFRDNYIWCITRKDTNECIIVDPGDASPVIAYCEQHNKKICAILITHHHADHIGGVSGLVHSQYMVSNATIYGPEETPCSHINHRCREGEQIDIPPLNITLSILEVPGHTMDHIAYYNQDWLFCGDTLFSCGCGRLFEGTPEIMFHSLRKIHALDDNTQVFCAHEYTQSNIDFALTIEPNNTALQQYANHVKRLRENQQETLPSTIGLEKDVNPFLRWHDAQLKENLSRHWQCEVSDDIETLAMTRRWKDTF